MKLISTFYDLKIGLSEFMKWDDAIRNSILLNRKRITPNRQPKLLFEIYVINNLSTSL